MDMKIVFLKEECRLRIFGIRVLRRYLDPRGSNRFKFEENGII
jgi:hypothetical protein